MFLVNSFLGSVYHNMKMSVIVMKGAPTALYITRGFRKEIDDVLYAETKGFDEIWMADPGLEREGITNMAAFATNTERMQVGTAVIPMWPRNPAILAAEVGSIWEMAPNRIKLGLGAWWEPLAGQVGIKRRKSLTVMREIVTVLRQLLNLETVDFHGEFVDFTNLKMEYINEEPEKRPVPLHVGATGFKMCELAGEIGDGAVLNYMVSVDYIRQCNEHVDIGAKRAGRSPTDVERPQLLTVALYEDDRDKALDAGRILLTEYLAREPHIMKACGVSKEILDKVHAEVRFPYTPEQIKKASRHVPDENVQKVLAAGTAKECRAKVREYVNVGTTMPILYPVMKNMRDVIDIFADGY